MNFLETEQLDAYYGDLQALFGINFAVAEGETVAVIGANGAGKSTFLKAICGLVEVPRDQIRLQQREIGGMAAHRVARLGVAMVPEGRRLFPSLTVEENLLMGAVANRKGPWDLNAVYKLFPPLRAMRKKWGTDISGGQQQMVAIGRALLSNPRLLLCDELSFGLAPLVIKEIYEAFGRVREEGMTTIIVEQDVQQAVRASSRLYCFLKGRVTLRGGSNDLSPEQISAAYFGG